MAQIIAVANQKGGTGKTTTTLNLGAALRELGNRVLLVDLDPQASLTLALGLNPDDLESTIYNALTRVIDAGEIDPAEINIVTTEEGLDMVPANIELSQADLDLVREPLGVYALRDLLRPLMERMSPTPFAKNGSGSGRRTRSPKSKTKRCVRSELLVRTARGELDREAVKQAVQIVQEQAAAAPPAPAPSTQKVQPQTQTEPPAVVVPPTTEADTGNVKVQPDLIERLSHRYDPLPNLRAALSRLEKLRPDRFADIDQATRPDVRAVLAEIISRSQYFLKELDDETER